MTKDEISEKCYELGGLLWTCIGALEDVGSRDEAYLNRQIGAVQQTLECAQRILDEIHSPFDRGGASYEIPDDGSAPLIAKEAS